MAHADNSRETRLPGAVLPRFGAPRMQGYLDACGGDPSAALELYRWNTQVSRAFWEALSHLEIVLRNLPADRLAARHCRVPALPAACPIERPHP